MFTYFYRIFDKYNRDVASMAILIDKNKNWRPNQFHRQIWKSKITKTYEMVKLIDYNSQKSQLLSNDNPFALVVLFQLAAMETKSTDKKRFLTKLEYFRCLHKHGWNIEKSMNLYRFLDTILTLSPKFELEYIEQVRSIDKEFNMELTLTAERYAFQRGEANVLINQLKAKFKEIPEEYLHKIEHADVTSIDKWSVNFVFANSLKEVFNK